MAAAADVAALRAAVLSGEVAGWDDHGGEVGRTYTTLEQLWRVQAAEREDFYAANDCFWAAGGYGGGVEEAMIGDGGSMEDVADSGRFLDRVLACHRSTQLMTALDAGAGVGRVTEHVLLPRCATVHLVEGCQRWSDVSRQRLGQASCTFATARLEDHTPPCNAYDLIWVQWTLQYLIDVDVVQLLRRLGEGLTATGLMVLKENAPSEGSSGLLFQVLRTRRSSPPRRAASHPPPHAGRRCRRPLVR